MHPRLLLALACLACVSTALAQDAHHARPDHGGAAAHAQNSYAGMKSREIKALSSQDIADLRAGKGMSLALPAELNGYPGPAHVLEVAGPLELTEAQRAGTRALFARMQAEARSAGEALIDAETVLDRLFKDRKADAAGVSQATAAAAVAHGKLRDTHLRYHLLMMELLTPAQVAAYNRLRGY